MSMRPRCGAPGKGKGPLKEAVSEDRDDDREEESEEAGDDVVEHDAGALRESFKAADGARLGDVEEAEEDQRERGVLPVRLHKDESDELAGYLVNDDEAGVFAAGLPRDDG
jgi:hypothetical protein